MVDIVIHDLTPKEAHRLRMLKLQLEERNWRTLFLRIIEDWDDLTTIKVREKEKK